MSVEDRLKTVSELREELRVAKKRASIRAKEIVEQEIAKVEAMLNAACRTAREDGASYAAIGRALGTKDFNTIKYRAASGFVNHATEYELESSNVLIINGVRHEFVQYEDTGTVEFFDTEFNDREYKAAVSFLRNKGAIQ